MTLHVESWGEGPRVFVGLHGWGGDHREFAPLAARRPPDARLVSFDLPGCGRSPPPSSWDAAALAETLAEAVARHGGAAPTLIGYCSGAALALLAAERRADGVARLVLIEPFAYVPWYFRIFLAGWFGRRAYYSAFAHRFGRRIVNGTLRRRQGGEEDFTAAFERVNHEAALRWLRLFADLGTASRFAGLRLPTDIVVGDRTFAAVGDSVRRYAAQWPHARVHRLAGVGHLPMRRAARQIAAIVFGESR